MIEDAELDHESLHRVQTGALVLTVAAAVVHEKCSLLMQSLRR
jgi:hypothetical protein